MIDRTYASTDCTGGEGETIKRKGGVSKACLGKSTSFIFDIHRVRMAKNVQVRVKMAEDRCLSTGKDG